MVDLDNVLHYCAAVGFTVLPQVDDTHRSLLTANPQVPQLGGNDTWHAAFVANTATLQGVKSLPSVRRSWLSGFANSLAARLLPDAGPGTWELQVTLPTPQAADQALIKAISRSADQRWAGAFDRVYLLTGDVGLIRDVEGLLKCPGRRTPERDTWTKDQRLWSVSLPAKVLRTRSNDLRGGVPAATPQHQTSVVRVRDPLTALSAAGLPIPHEPDELGRLAEDFPAVLTQVGGASFPRAIVRFADAQPTLQVVTPAEGLVHPGQLKTGTVFGRALDPIYSSDGMLYLDEADALATTALPPHVVGLAVSAQFPLTVDLTTTSKGCAARLRDRAVLQFMKAKNLRGKSVSLTRLTQYSSELTARGAWWTASHAEGQLRATGTVRVGIPQGAIPLGTDLAGVSGSYAAARVSLLTDSGEASLFSDDEDLELVVRAQPGIVTALRDMAPYTLVSARQANGAKVALFTIHALKEGQCVHGVPIQVVPTSITGLPPESRRLPILFAVSEPHASRVSVA